MIKLIDGGNIRKKGYYYQIGVFLPTFMLKSETRSIHGGKYRTTVFDFPTTFHLTSNNNYCSIYIRVFGFGMGLEIQTRS
jgi:hypothetical protein